MNDNLYVIHNINNPKGMVRGDGGFTEGMLLSFYFSAGCQTLLYFLLLKFTVVSLLGHLCAFKEN